jgi:hypothetical protein
VKKSTSAAPRLDDEFVQAVARQVVKELPADRFVKDVAKKLRGSIGSVISGEWLPLRLLGQRHGASRVTVWRFIKAVNGKVTADDGPIRRRRLSRKLVVYSVVDFDRELAKRARALKA